MALFKFTRRILEGQPIDAYNHGQMWHDFIYVSDLLRCIWLLIGIIPGGPVTAVSGDSLSAVAPNRVVNISDSEKDRLEDFIDAIEVSVGRKAICNHMLMRAGDDSATWADAGLLQRLTGYRP